MDLSDYVVAGINTINQLYAGYISQYVTPIGVAISLEVLILLMLFRISRKRHRRGSWMTTSKREAYVERHAADLITDALDDAKERGELTAKEVNELYRKMGKAMTLSDLIGRDWKVLKKAIKTRLRNGFYKKPIPIPGAELTPKAKLRTISLGKKS